MKVHLGETLTAYIRQVIKEDGRSPCGEHSVDDTIIGPGRIVLRDPRVFQEDIDLMNIAVCCVTVKCSVCGVERNLDVAVDSRKVRVDLMP